MYYASSGDYARTLDGAAMVPTQILDNNDTLVLARNWMTGASGPPVCFDDKMIVREREDVVCYGYTGEDGKAYEADVVARTLLSTQLPPAVPADDPVPIELPYEPSQYPALTFGVGQVYPEVMLGSLTFASHPIPLERAADLKALIDGDQRGETWLQLFKDYGMGASRTIGGVNFSARSIEYLPIIGLGEIRTAGAYTWKKVAVREQQFGAYYYLDKFHEGQANTVCIYGFTLAFDRDITMRLTLGRDHGVTAWIDGIPIRDGQRFHAQYGRHQLLVMTEVRSEDELKETLRPVLWDARTPEYEKRHRQERLDAMRPWLERAAEHVRDAVLKEQITKVLM
jgi:hypothetical protein